MSANRLLHSQSPYLLQHAHNPVDWYPWGPAALTRASEENKPILVSIGYSACHWCHVMERESFEDTATAALMNEHFVCIKIDREERPDLDNIYMDAVQAMGLQGGWPLNVFLMPNQKPFYGGTYFPNSKWKQLLGSIADAYAVHADQLAESAEGFGRSLNRKETDKYGIQAEEGDLDPDELVEVITKLSAQFDPEWGGMNRVPKFPMPAIWHFVLDYALLASREDLKQSVFFTLQKMGMGGIYDHLRGGFARYSVDGEWFAPHFEKMGYDNGQLLELYAKAFQVSKDDFFLEKVRETKDWLLAEMMQEEGGFHAAQDADSEGVEGKFYTWTAAELQELLGADFGWFSSLYSITSEGNWEEGVNILFQVESYEQVAKEQGIPLEDFLQKLAVIKKILLQHRNQRIYPGKDDKVLAGWNGLLDAGLIQAYFASGEEEFLELALRNLDFAQVKLFQAGILYRSYKNGQAYTPAFLEDYAALIRASLMAFSASGLSRHLNFAQALVEVVLARFYDAEDGYFYFSDPTAEKLIANKKELFDNVIPASNSILARSLHQLSLFTYKENYGEIAARMLGGMKELVLKEPGFLCNWANFYLESLVPTAEIAIVGRGAKEKALALLANYLPNAVVAWSESPTASVPLLEGKLGDAEGNALIYVCVNRSCRRPVATVEEARALVPQLN
jgi:uncharacterized protein YyaL (SSP411 family)